MFGTIQFKLIAIAIAVLLTFFAGWIVNGWRYEKQIAITKIAEQKVIQEKQQENQAQTDLIRKAKDDQIAYINNQLADALVSLRSRSSRSQYSAVNGQDGTGRSLSAEDAEFLVREATRADEIRTALDACYKQYDSITR